MTALSPDIMFEFCAERRKCLKDEGRMGNADFFMLGILGLDKIRVLIRG